MTHALGALRVRVSNEQELGMRRMALVLTGVGVVLALCAPTLRAEDQQRSRRSRNSEAATCRRRLQPGARLRRRLVAPCHGGRRPFVPERKVATNRHPRSAGRRRAERPPQTSGARRRVQAAPQSEQPAVRQRRPDPANQGRTTRRAVPRVRSGSETRPAGRTGGRDGRVDGRADAESDIPSRPDPAGRGQSAAE